MECLQLRSPPPGPFHYLISEQAKSLVALQELQNEVGALLEFRDLVIETFPNLRSKMAPSTPAAARREWEPGVRVRRKLAAGQDSARAKPQPSVQDSGFSTETSCGKDVNSASASRTSRPIEDELWALLDVIQRKGVRLREEAESLRSELDDRVETAEESFARALTKTECDCNESRRLREERDALLSRTAQLEASVLSGRVPPGPPAPPASPATPLGRLDRVLATPLRPPRVPTPDTKKFAAILQESNPVELQRQLLTCTVQSQVLSERLKRMSEQRTALLDKLERARDVNDDLKFQLEEKTIELEGARAIVRQLEKQRTPSSESRGGGGGGGGARERDSMRDMEPLTLPDEEARITETPRRARPSRIPLPGGAGAGAGAGGGGTRRAAPRSRSGESRPPSALSAASARSRHSASSLPRKDPAKKPTAVPVRRPPLPETKESRQGHANIATERACVNLVTSGRERGCECELAAEYVSRASRLAERAERRVFSRLGAGAGATCLALELSRSVLYAAELAPALAADALWAGRPQHYFESMRYCEEGPTAQP